MPEPGGTYTELVLEGLARDPGRVALHHGGVTMTAQECLDMVYRMARALIGPGSGAGTGSPCSPGTPPRRCWCGWPPTCWAAGWRCRTRRPRSPIWWRRRAQPGPAGACARRSRRRAGRGADGAAAALLGPGARGRPVRPRHRADPPGDPVERARQARPAGAACPGRGAERAGRHRAGGAQGGVTRPVGASSARASHLLRGGRREETDRGHSTVRAELPIHPGGAPSYRPQEALP